MANVVPIKNRKRLRKIYFLRLGIVASFLFAGALSVGIAALVPVYTSVRTQLYTDSVNQKLQSNIYKSIKEGVAMKEALRTQTQISVLLKTDKSSVVRALEYTLRDWRLHAKDIIFTSIVYTRKTSQKKGNVTTASSNTPFMTMRISGVARDRGSLNRFIVTMRIDPAFNDIAFPVSDLKSQKDIHFSVTAKVLF